MPYYNVTPHILYQSCLQDWNNGATELDRACAWVQAINTYDVHELHAQVFHALESGEAKQWVPDPNWIPSLPPEEKLPPTAELADKYVQDLEADYGLEKRRFPRGRGPDFTRLLPPARLRLAQMAYDLHKTKKQIIKKARERLAAGELLPPPKDAQTEEVLLRRGHASNA